MNPVKRLNERVKELTALHEISMILSSYHETYEMILLKAVSVLVNAFQFSNITACRITFGIYSAQSGNFKKTDWMLVSEFDVLNEKGKIEAAYLEEKPNAFSGPFLEEETQLLDSAAKLLEVYLIRRQKDDEMNKLLEKKELMLKELHHRVRNNLQIILSLLRLQGASLTDTKSRDLIKLSENRVKALSVIHEKLYGTIDLQNFDYRDCIKELLEHLFISYSAASQHIHYVLDCARLPISIDQAIPLGLTINELVTNSIRHAFIDNEEGLVRLKIFCVDKFCTFEYCDNGRGLPESTDVRNPITLGYQIINSLTSQLDGKKESTSGKEGFRFVLKFPINE